jgi:hypothetical protein
VPSGLRSGLAGVRLDIVVLADPRVGDVAAPSHAAALAALSGAGYRVGLLPIVGGGIDADPFQISPDLGGLLNRGEVHRLGPGVRADCALALAFDARIFSVRPATGARIQAAHRLVTVERPAPIASAGGRDLNQLADAAASALGGAPLWAPTTPIAREALAFAVPHWPLAPDIWWPVAPRTRSQASSATVRSRPVVGRARIARSRPGWLGRRPGEQVAIPDDPLVLFRVRQAPDAQRHPWPRKGVAEVWPDRGIDFEAFLAKIDILANHDVAADDPCPIEALMALSVGAIPYLPDEYRSIFAGAAMYGGAAELSRTAIDLHTDRSMAAAALAAGKDILEEVYSPERFVERISHVIGPPRATSFAPRTNAVGRTRVLFYSTNGVGMGHLTRQLAVARRLPANVAPVFVSHSQAVDIVRSYGFIAEHLPYHAAYGEAKEHWNAGLTEVLDAAIGFYGASALVFDGNVPFVGLLAALERRPHVARIWIRRGLWGAGRDPDALERSSAFDLVMEPGEPAWMHDRGPTADRASEVLALDPVRLLDGTELPPRAIACAQLGLDPEQINVLVAAGSGNNFDTGSLAQLAISGWAGRGRVRMAIADWMIANARTVVPPGVVRITGFPFAKYLNAFDFAIAAAGYNTFVEHLSAALPTIWVPNENSLMDLQIHRAQFASDAGVGLLVRIGEPFQLDPAMTAMLDQSVRMRMREAGLALSASILVRNGASDAAAAVTNLGTSVIARNIGAHIP